MKSPNTIVKNRLVPPKAFFDWCMTHIPVYRFSNKAETIVSCDGSTSGRDIINKRLTKATNYKKLESFHTFAIILVSKKRIEIQSYAYWVKYINGKEYITSELSNIERFSENRHYKVGRWEYGRYYYGLSPNYSGMGGAYERTKFYENNWIEKLAESELKYVDFDFTMNRHLLSKVYLYRNEIEYLQKIKANHMALEVITGNADMRTINSKWLSANKVNIRKSDKSFYEYELEQRIRQRKGKIVPGIEKFLKYSDIGKIPKGIGIVKFQNWVIKNKVSFRYYLDYISLQKDLGIELSNENLIIPTDLEKAHDNAVKLLNRLKREADEKLYEKRISKLHKFNWKKNDYVIVVPKKAQDIIQEGKALHHCVGGSNYVDGHINGTTTILFVRSIGEMDKPLYTLEFKNNRISQLRGKHNKSAPKDVVKFTEDWFTHLKTDKIISVKS